MEKYWRYRLVSLISGMSASCQPAVNTRVVISQRATLRTFWFVSAPRGMRTLYYQKPESREMNNALQVHHSLFYSKLVLFIWKSGAKTLFTLLESPFPLRGCYL